VASAVLLSGEGPGGTFVGMMGLIEILGNVWNVVAAILTVVLSVIASGHAVLYKRDSRAAIGWVGLIWLVPIVGAVLYALLGINRIRRQAADQRAQHPILSSGAFLPVVRPAAGGLTAPLEHLQSLADLVDRITGQPLTAGNAVTPLENGEQAYPAMLEAIDDAETSIALSTYIFDNDYAGRLFTAALERAARRGVQVRVLIDTVGARYSRPSIVKALTDRGIRVARFGRTVLPWRMPYMNLRNHRKLLVIDGRIGFTGGMNIREGTLVERPTRYPVRDLHFRIDGPAVTQLAGAFAQDWVFTTHERLTGAAWLPEIPPTGPVAARGIADGPDEDFDKARFVFMGALACAKQRVRIVTPYFLPPAGLISALDVAALRGVRIEIILPEVVNLAVVQWAATAQLWQVLYRGCRVYYTPPPFDHSKLMLVDDSWALFGSTNWDPRSLRLNFEFGVECYDMTLAAQLHELVDRKLEGARQITAEDVNRRPLLIRLRDGIARLAAPYL
jgi:cardiolipin synthase